jgi:hypothetical protein
MRELDEVECFAPVYRTLHVTRYALSGNKHRWFAP